VGKKKTFEKDNIIKGIIKWLHFYRNFHFKALVIGLFLICIYLSLKGLDNCYFWDDEAHVAIFARNLLSTGKLTGWDGRNLFGFRNGTLLDKNLCSINSPLDYLLCALSFKLFGYSTWTGRILFVIMGLIALGIFSLILKEDFGKDKWLWVFSFCGFAFSTVFLLHIRQCRYYSLSLLFSLLTFYFYRQSILKKKAYDFIFLALSAVLLFYSNYLLAVAFLLSLGIIHFIFHFRRLSGKEWLRLALSVTLFIIFTIPYGIKNRVWYRPDIPVNQPFLPWKLELLWWNIRELNLITCLPWVVVVGLIVFIFCYWKKEGMVKKILELGLLVLSNTFFVTLFSPQSTQVTSIADVRYLIASVPFCYGLFGIFLWFIHRWNKVVALVLFGIIITTNLLTVTPFNWKFRWLLPAYIYEVHNEYPTAYSEVVKYLEKNAKQDEQVYCFPEYTNYPLMFYLGDKIKFCCLLDKNTHLPYEKVKSLNAPLFIEENFPDWFIAFGGDPNAVRLLQFFSRPHLEGEKEVQFKYQFVGIIDVYGIDMTRPELPWHSFGPIKNFDRQTSAVYVFRRLL